MEKNQRTENSIRFVEQGLSDTRRDSGTVSSDNAVSPRKCFECDRAESVLLFMSILFGYGFVHVLENYGTGLSVLLSVTAFYLITFVYCKLAGLRPDNGKETVVSGIIVFLLSLAFVLFDINQGRAIILWLALLCAMAINLYAMLNVRQCTFGDEGFYRDWLDAVFVMPFSNLGSSWSCIGRTGKNSHGRNVLLGILGFIVGIPVIAILIALLSEADVAFNQMVEGILTVIEENCMEEILLFLLSIPFAMVAFGVLYGLRYKRGIGKTKDHSKTGKRIIPLGAALGLLIPVVLIYLAYVLSQLAYFTSAFSGLLPADFTYAEYARQGFFELCKVCVLNLILMLAAISFVRAGELFRRIVGSFFCLVSLFLASTAMAKMLLYVHTYGLTPLRLETSLLMITLSLMFLFILIRTHCYRFPIAQCIAVTVIVAVLLYGYTNPEAVSVSYNLHAIEEERIADSAYYAGFDKDELVWMNAGVTLILQEHTEDKKACEVLEQQYYIDSTESRTIKIMEWNLESWLARE